MTDDKPLNDYQRALMRVKQHSAFGSYNKMAKYLGLTQRGVNKWFHDGMPPRTEYTGETDYAERLSAAVGGEITPDELRPPRVPKQTLQQAAG